MSFINEFLTHALITTLLIIGFLAARDLSDSLQGKIVIALSLSLAFLTWINIKQVYGLSEPLYFFLRFLSIPNIGLLWWFMLSLLKDDFRLGRFEWIGMLLLCFAPFIYWLDRLGFSIPYWNEINIYGGIAPFIMIAHLIWVALSERSNDLVEPRRRARTWLSAAILIAVLISLLSEYLENQLTESLLRNGFALPVTWLWLFWLSRMQKEVLRFELRKQRTKDSTGIDPKDHALHQNLLKLMQEQQLYKQHGLTINILAQKLNTQDHRLRVLINRGMGYRNFPAFLSSYRMDYIKSVLADPEQARVPILTVALDAGYASLQTFNRVFKQAEGVTPSHYRMEILNKLSQK